MIHVSSFKFNYVECLGYQMYGNFSKLYVMFIISSESKWLETANIQQSVLTIYTKHRTEKERQDNNIWFVIETWLNTLWAMCYIVFLC